jgi:PilZ domain
VNTTSLSQAERRQIVSVINELKEMGQIFGRRHRRRMVNQLMWLKRLPRPDYPRPAAFKIRSEDVSLKGIGFQTRRRLYKNEQVVIPLQFQEGGGMLVLSRVCFCRELPNGGYRVGAEFADTLADPQCKERIPQTWLKSAWASEVQK